VSRFKWDPLFTCEQIELTAENRSIFLREDTYLFRSVIADKCFDSGIHYWELIADSRSDNEMKIGVTKNKDFDLKTSFSDYSFGWAFYGIG
jgi:E3 ubiquitin-protein ligase NRDP1